VCSSDLPHVWVGVGGSLSGTTVTDGTVGLSVTATQLHLVSLTDDLGVTYTGLQITGIAGSLTGVPGVELNVSGGLVKLNKSSGAAKLDWTAAAYSTFGLAIPATTDLELAGTVGINVGSGFAVASGSFHLLSGQFSGSGGGATFTSKPVFELSITSPQVWVGVGGSLSGTTVVDGTVGLSVTATQLQLVSLTDDLGVTYTGLQITGIAGSLTGVPGVELNVSGGLVKLNKSSGAAKLDWTAAAYSTFGLAIPATTDLELAGTVGINVGSGFAVASGSFHLLSGQFSGSGGGATFTSKPVFELSITSPQVWVGVGGSLSGTTVVDGTVGLSVTATQLHLVSLTDDLGVTYTGLQITGIAGSLSGVPGVELNVSGGLVKLNKSSGAAKLDWTAAAYSTFGLAIPATTDLELAGTVGINVGDFVLASGTLNLTITTSVASKDDHHGIVLPNDAQALVLTVTGAHLFIGAGGSLSGTTVTDGTIGLSASVASFTFVPIDPAVTTYSALQITGMSGSIVGVPSLQLDVTGVSVAVNKVSPAGQKLDWAGLNMFG